MESMEKILEKRLPVLSEKDFLLYIFSMFFVR